MAARQLNLILYVDSTQYAQDDEDEGENRTWTSASENSALFYGDSSGKIITRYLGTRLINAPPVEKAGIWPYEEKETYPEFIIGTDDEGEDATYTCDPDALANYFGRNPDSPHYLTPVYFRKEVLRKYYERPGLYRVTDGRLSCVSLWGVQIDNSARDAVVVFLGDLGRDLPQAERGYWRSHNIAPEGRPSETMLRRSLLGQFADPDAIDLKVRLSYVRFMKSWRGRFDWDLFREPTGVDAGLLDRLRLPLDEDQPEFESSIRVLAQLLVEALDESTIQKNLPSKIEDEKGIGKLSRFLSIESYPEVDRDIKFLRGLQSVRSTATAHRKSSDYESRLTSVLGELRG